MLWKEYPQVWKWLNFVAALTLVFWLTGWDLVISGWFYDPAYPQQPWWLQRHRLLHYLFYESVPVISVLLLFGSTAIILVTSWQRRHHCLRLQTAYVLLVFLLGPGILVNAVFKDHWGRARPVDVVEFGGQRVYTPPGLYVAKGEGRSFPSGHSSIGFAFIAFWFVWRRRYPRRAAWALWFSMVFGSLIGLTRVLAGGHFITDVIWSALMVSFIGWLVYYPLLRVPEREARYLERGQSSR